MSLIFRRLSLPVIHKNMFAFWRFTRLAPIVSRSFHTTYCVGSSAENKIENKTGSKNLTKFKDLSVENRILFADSVDTVFEIAEKQVLSTENLNLVLKKCLQLMADEVSVTVNESWRQKLMELIKPLQVDAAKLQPGAMLDSLEHLMKIFPTDNSVIETLESRVQTEFQKLSIPHLIRLVQMHSNATTNLRCQVRDKALLSIERRWVEIVSPKDLVSLFYLVTSKDSKLLRHLEEKTLDLSGSMSLKELYHVMYKMARLRDRNVPALRSLVYHMNKYQLLDLSPVQLANLSYACATLNVYDSDLIGNILKAALTDSFLVPQYFHLHSSIINSFGIMRWRSEELIDSVLKLFLKNLDAVQPEHWVSIFKATASFGYLPMELARNMEIIMKRISGLAASSPHMWLDVVWSTVIHSNKTCHLAETVLNKEFLNLIKGSNSSISNIGTNKKLLNINEVARNSTLYKGPLLSDDVVGKTSMLFPIWHKTALMDVILNTLNEIGTLEKYFRVGTSTPAGFFIDAEMVVNKLGQLQPVKEYEPGFAKKSLPPGYHRVAVKALDFTDMTSGSVHPTGLSSFIIRQLQQNDYKVIQTHTKADQTNKLMPYAFLNKNVFNCLLKTDSVSLMSGSLTGSAALGIRRQYDNGEEGAIYIEQTEKHAEPENREVPDDDLVITQNVLEHWSATSGTRVESPTQMKNETSGGDKSTENTSAIGATMTTVVTTAGSPTRMKNGTSIKTSDEIDAEKKLVAATMKNKDFIKMIMDENDVDAAKPRKSPDAGHVMTTMNKKDFIKTMSEKKMAGTTKESPPTEKKRIEEKVEVMNESSKEEEKNATKVEIKVGSTEKKTKVMEKKADTKKTEKKKTDGKKIEDATEKKDGLDPETPKKDASKVEKKTIKGKKVAKIVGDNAPDDGAASVQKGTEERKSGAKTKLKSSKTKTEKPKTEKTRTEKKSGLTKESEEASSIHTELKSTESTSEVVAELSTKNTKPEKSNSLDLENCDMSKPTLESPNVDNITGSQTSRETSQETLDHPTKLDEPQITKNTPK